MLLLIYCFMYLTLFVGVLCWSLFWYALLCFFSSFAVPWVCLPFVIVVFPDHTHLLILQSSCRGCFALIIFLMSFYCKCYVAIPHGAVGWSAVCDCGIS